VFVFFGFFRAAKGEDRDAAEEPDGYFWDAVHRQVGGQTALMMAAYTGRVHVLEQIFAASPIHRRHEMLDAQHTSGAGGATDGKTAMMYALDGWSERNKRGHGATLLTETQRADFNACVAALIAAGARRTVTTADGTTAVLMAAKTRNQVALELLLDGCDEDPEVARATVRAGPGRRAVGLVLELVDGFSSFHKVVATLLLRGQHDHSAQTHDSLSAWGVAGDKVASVGRTTLGVVDVRTGAEGTGAAAAAAAPGPNVVVATHDRSNRDASKSALSSASHGTMPLLQSSLAASGTETNPAILRHVIGAWTARLVKTVVDKCPRIAAELVEARGDGNRTAAHVAAVAGDSQTLSIILASATSAFQAAGSKGPGGLTALHYAATHGHVAAVKTVLKAVAAELDANVARLCSSADDEGRTAAELALTPAVALALSRGGCNSVSSGTHSTGCQGHSAGPQVGSCAAGIGDCNEVSAAAILMARGTRTSGGSVPAFGLRAPDAWWNNSSSTHVPQPRGAATLPLGETAFATGSPAPGHASHDGCDFAVADAATLTKEQFYANHLYTHTPLLIRGGAKGWPAASWTVRRFAAEHGNAEVAVGTIPFAGQFGLAASKMRFGRYLDTHMRNKNHDTSPPYVFDTELLKDPEGLIQAIKVPSWFAGLKMHPLSLMAGPVGSGAPPHFHISAWNALLVGQKRWTFLPPEGALMSKAPIHDWREPDSARRCVQNKGDIMFVPSGYTHAVYNLKPSIAVAVEFYGPTVR
jgi:ankyrin repeat protein